MAPNPLLQLTDVSLTFGGEPVFDALSLTVHSGDRVALVGRNGSGKSTLMKVMAGLVEPDRGDRVVPAGTSVGYMEQDPDLSGYETLGAFAASALAPSEMYRVERASEGLKFDPDRPVSTASGGERRRAALAKLMAEAPDLMLLDEPTNHLDIESREALVDALTAYSGAVILVSHDMHLLSMVADRLWLVKDGHVNTYEDDLQAYRKMLLTPDKPAKQGKAAKQADKPKAKRPSQDQIKAMKADARKCEERVNKINEMRDKLAKKLADPVLYEDGRKGELETWNRKYAEVMEALERAEAMWMAALEKLDKAQV